MQLDEYCVVFPQCHILEVFYIQICCTWTKYISLNDTVIGRLFK